MSGTENILKKHSIVIAGHSTSITLENIFWDLLKEIVQKNNQSLSQIIADIDALRDQNTPSNTTTPNLSSAIRTYILKEILAKDSSRK